MRVNHRCHATLRLPRSIRRACFEAVQLLKDGNDVYHCRSPCWLAACRLQRPMPHVVFLEANMAQSVQRSNVLFVCVVQMQAFGLLIDCARAHTSARAAAAPRDTSSRERLVIACQMCTACLRRAALSRQGRCAIGAVQTPSATPVQLLATVLGLADSLANSKWRTCFHWSSPFCVVCGVTDQLCEAALHQPCP